MVPFNEGSIHGVRRLFLYAGAMLGAVGSSGVGAGPGSAAARYSAGALAVPREGGDGV